MTPTAGQPAEPFVWLPAFAVADPQLDAEHQALVAGLNRLASLHVEEAAAAAWAREAQAVVGEACRHFEAEEARWARLPPGAFGDHLEQHAQLKARLEALVGLPLDDGAAVRAALGAAGQALARHILQDDDRMARAERAGTPPAELASAEAAPVAEALLALHRQHFDDTLALRASERREARAGQQVRRLLSRWHASRRSGLGGWRWFAGQAEAPQLPQLIAEVEALLAAMPDPAIVAGDDGRVLALSEEAVRFFGVDADALLGHTALSLHPPAVHDDVWGRLLAWLKSGRPWYRFETKVLRHGQPLAVELTNARSLLPNGRAVIVSVYRDLTERRALEVARRGALDRLRDILDGLPAGVLAARSPEGPFVFSNQRMRALTGYGEAELAAMGPLSLHPPEAAERVRTEFARMGQGDPDPVLELPVMRKDGSRFYADIHRVPVSLDDERAVVAMFLDVTRRREITQALRRQEQRNRLLLTRDPLTGLANRAHFLQLLAGHTRDAPLTVLALDLDGFGALSATLRPGEADGVLQSVAEVLRTFAPAAVALGRTSRDEFVAAWADLTSDGFRATHLTALTDRLAQCVPGVTLSACVGLSGAHAVGEDVSANQLLREALRAMYSAKQRGPRQVRVFGVAADRRERARFARLDRIAHGLDAGEFVLHYQPQVHLRTGQLKRLEALVRWAHPELGLLPPSRFLPDLAGDPLLIQLGDVVLRQAVAQQAAWRLAGLDAAVSVNVDAIQLADAGFPDRVEALLDEHPELRPGALCLEMLETSALEITQQVADLMTRLMRRGVRFAVDDFGTGYASLTFLKKLPAAVVKIDQSFVRGMLADLEQAVIVDSIVGLARGLGRLVVAEGVEAEEHGVRLLALGCELGQGYAIARPMPAEMVPEWVQRWRPPDRWQRTQPVARERVAAQMAVWHHQSWLDEVHARVGGRLSSSLRSVDTCPILPWLGDGPAGEARRHEHRALHTQADALLAHAAAHGAEAPGTEALWQALRRANERFVAVLDTVHTPPPQA